MARRDYDDYDEEEWEEDNERYTIRRAKKDILREMRKYPKTSDEYMALSQRLTEITECERNQWGWIAPTIIQGVTGAANTFISYRMNRKTVKDVLDFEDRGNILNTKAAGYLKKPRE